MKKDPFTFHKKKSSLINLYYINKQKDIGENQEYLLAYNVKLREKNHVRFQGISLGLDTYWKIWNSFFFIII